MVAAVRDTICEAFCKHCGAEYILTVNKSDMYDWYSGSLPIQQALHYLSASERELILSGTCGDCFDKMFPPLDSDE